MIDRILRDTQLRPRLFHWNGPLNAAGLDRWEREQALRIPEDLKLLWTTKGGGDMFESETILQPFGAPEYDLVLPVSQVWWGRGLSASYVVFHTGVHLSVFRKCDAVLFNCPSERPNEMVPVRDLDDWYANHIRPLFAECYGLPPIATGNL